MLHANPQEAIRTEPPLTDGVVRDSPLLTSSEAAEYLRVSREWLEKMRVIGRSRKGSPRFVRIGRRCFYRIDELESFIDENTAASTSEY